MSDLPADSGERNLKLVLEYDGTHYAGWQLQDELPTIQLRLVQALTTMTGVFPVINVAGRTDAGVHALGQVANFRTTSKIPARRFVRGLNGLLPRDISVHSVTEVPLSFDARHDSLSKWYRYRTYVAPERAALVASRSWHSRRRLEVEAMRQAAASLVGSHDFEAFRSSDCDALHARRNMLTIEIAAHPRPPSGELVEIFFHANAFCRYMCRILAGTLVEVGQGRRTVESVGEALAAKDRRLAGVTAPPEGLTLMQVLYP